MQIKRSNERHFRIGINNKEIDTPFHFASISSIKTNYRIEEYLDIIDKVGYPGFLLSSYDIFTLKDCQINRVVDGLSSADNKGILTLMDSGHYEAYWYRDSNWPIKNYEKVLSSIKTDLCFSYDVFFEDDKNMSKHMDETKAMISRTVGAQKGSCTIPLLHCDKLNLPLFAKQLVQEINPEIIGIPERELGDTVFERCTTLKRIRDQVDETGYNVPIHLLGTGNPISLMMYTLCGADLFDGLEWCKTVVDPKSAKLYHFIQKPLFECKCDYCVNEKLSYPVQTMAHNLRFFSDFANEIGKAIDDNSVDRLMNKYLESSVVEKIKENVGV